MKLKCTTSCCNCVALNVAGTWGGEGRDLAIAEVPQGMLRMIPWQKSALHRVAMFGRVSSSWSCEIESEGGVRQ